MIRKRFACNFKATDLAKGMFEGHASIFHIPDDGRPPDIMLPGAFAKTIMEWGPKGANRIKILALHRTDWLPIGRPLELAEDEQGLFFRGKVSDTSLGRDVLTLMQDEVITEMSIGFDIIKYEIDKNVGVRRLQEVKLWEISPVTWAMHPNARIAAVKDLLSACCEDREELLADPEILKSIQALLSTVKPETPPSSTSTGTAAAPAYDPDMVQSLKALTAEVVAATELRRTV